MNKKLGLIACAAALQLLHTGSQAAAVISIQEVGLDVVATGTGTLDLAGFTSFGAARVSEAIITPSSAIVIIGGLGFYDLYQGSLSGPSSFGSNVTTTTMTGSGGMIGLNGQSSLIYVPTGYVSNGPLLGSSTFLGKSLSSIGATPGTYSYVLGNGDSFTVQIGPVAAVPEPSSVAMMIAGLAFVAGVGARRRSGRKSSSQDIS